MRIPHAMSARTRPAALSLAAIATASCATVISSNEYSLYRAYRYESGGAERLAAGGRYLQDYPQGRYAPDVQRDVFGAEEEFWGTHRSDASGLNEYLAAFPRGPHAEEARQRLEAFEQRRQQEEEERRRTAEQDRARREEELRTSNARARMWARVTFSKWMRVFGGLHAWGQGMGPIVQANPDFAAQFENDPPQCRASHCRKNYLTDFSIPIPGRTAASRRINFTLDMVRTGRERLVNQVMLVVHERGLTRWWESENQQIVEDSNAEARETAVRWTMDQLRAALVTSFPEARETPPELYGPPPEAVMQGVEEDENATPPPTDPNACVLLSQPLGTRWSAVVGCAGVSTAAVRAPQEATEAHARSMTADEAPVTPQTCLRVDAYAALDGEGMSTDEGVVITAIPACALRGRPAARPPAARPPVARPPAARPAGAAPVARPPAARPAAPAARPPA